MNKWDKREKENLGKLSLKLNASIPYDEDLFNLSKNWDHIHSCYQCNRKFGCNGEICDPESDEIGWCADCCNAEYVTTFTGGN